MTGIGLPLLERKCVAALLTVVILAGVGLLLPDPSMSQEGPACRTKSCMKVPNRLEEAGTNPSNSASFSDTYFETDADRIFWSDVPDKTRSDSWCVLVQDTTTRSTAVGEYLCSWLKVFITGYGEPLPAILFWVVSVIFLVGGIGGTIAGLQKGYRGGIGYYAAVLLILVVPGYVAAIPVLAAIPSARIIYTPWRVIYVDNNLVEPVRVRFGDGQFVLDAKTHTPVYLNTGKYDVEITGTNSNRTALARTIAVEPSMWSLVVNVGNSYRIRKAFYSIRGR
jgi:hypothetical protein